MRILIACEFSGRVRDAFAAKGHEAWSCDLLPSETIGNHYQCAVEEILGSDWDMMVAHPPCTHLAVSGAAWFKNKQKEQEEALQFVQMLMDAPIPKICIENPVSIISSRIKKPTQYIQPWQFGHAETKKTCLWLKNLLPLRPTDIVEPKFIIGKKDGKRYSPTHYQSYSKGERWKIRSRTYRGIADAMAHQWG